MPANENTVFQFNIKIGNDLHNVYADNGAEAIELLDFFTENLLPKLVSVGQVVNGSVTVASTIPVAPPAQQNATAPPFVPQPQPGAPAQHVCEHGQPMKLIPAGVSKSTGKPYSAFYACAQPRGSQCQSKVYA